MTKCEFCNYAENINQTRNQNFIVCIDNNKKLFVKYNNSLAIDEIVIPVNYCPMCGRKLVQE